MMTCGWDHTLAVTEEGSVYAWGRNYTAQCGTGTRDNVKFPEKLIIGKVKQIACGCRTFYGFAREWTGVWMGREW